MGDIGLLLREAMIASPAADTRVASRRRSFLWPAVVGLLGLLLVVALVTRRGGDDAGVNDAARIIGMSQLTDLPGYQTEPSLSPDGKQLLYVAMDGGDLDIFLQRVGGE
ncbi:MAG: hypothetical protein GWN46_25825, partial [Gammaproteobacteria bacterium]|nr:hypothetical protein [Gammaproteobacteria bacterium]